MFTKRFWQLASGFVAIVIVGLLIFWASSMVVERQNPQYKAEKEALKQLDELERLYREDPYGGDTPEETLELFISALKADDIDLASKYFLPDEWEEWKGNLQRVKDNGNLEEMVADLSGRKSSYKISENMTGLDIINTSNEVVAALEISKSINGKWKITNL